MINIDDTDMLGIDHNRLSPLSITKSVDGKSLENLENSHESMRSKSVLFINAMNKRAYKA